MAKKPLPHKLVITTGDTDGIGLEVTLKALRTLRLPTSHTLDIFLPQNTHKSLTRHLKIIESKFSSHKINFIRRSDSPALWIEEATALCLNGKYKGLVTAPISKTEIANAGMKDIGHTDIFARLSGNKTLFMGFVGPHFNVVLATSHVPLSMVPKTLTEDKLFSAILAAHEFSKYLPTSFRKKPLALLGLNPHAGESGLIGYEESNFFHRALSHAHVKKINVIGPLSPDAAFAKCNWKKFSAYVCCYHDQGLIPFKMIHGQDHGVHITIGLPFIRTSVDHGTAKDIFGKDRANPNSMKEALNLAISLTR